MKPLILMLIVGWLPGAAIFRLPVLDPGRGRTKTGRLWCYAVDDRPWRGESHPAAAYVYSEDRRGLRPSEHLATFQADSLPAALAVSRTVQPVVRPRQEVTVGPTQHLYITR